MSANPRFQIIRGLPGSGKSTAAKRYDCLHLELDQYCVRGGAYRWGVKRDADARVWVCRVARIALHARIDLVLAGVIPCADPVLEHLVADALKEGYEVWIADLEAAHENRHCVRPQDYERFASKFVSSDMLVASVPDLETLQADGRLHFGLMPEALDLIPEEDGK